uniref:DUF4378 domain-containing protein n=1 Tax=Fagus sylvatica TaxID=28930 RepID=A0A2N9HIZ6_FAGSY
MESKERMPSVIARLMGLDELPPQQPVQKQKRVLSEYYLQRVASIGVREKRASFRISSEEQKELGYIFRVLETLNRDKQHNLSVEDRKISSSSSEERMAFISQNFSGEKCISVDKKLQNSKELQDSMGITDSKKDLCPKYLQEPDSLFTKHLQDWQSVPPYSQFEHHTVSKSSHTSYHSNMVKCGKLGRTTLQGNVKLLQKPDNGLVRNLHGELGLDNICNYSRSELESNGEGCHPSTRIVVLKPNNGNPENDAQCFASPSSYEGSLLGDGELKYFPILDKGKFDIEVKERKSLMYDMEPTTRRHRVSREISEEVTGQTRHGTIGISTMVSWSGMRVDGTVAKDSELIMPSNFSDWKNQYKSSFSLSHGSYVAREAKRQISERWKMNKKFQKDGLAGRASTLGELLAMPDHETGTRNVDYKRSKHGLNNQTGSNDGHVNSGGPLSISSKNGLKDGSNRNLPKSRSFSVSSSATKSPRNRTRYEGLQSDWNLSLEESVNWAQHKSGKQNLNQKDGFECGNLFSYEKFHSFSCLDLENNHTVDEVKSKLERDLSDHNFMGTQSSSSSFSYSDLENNYIVQDTWLVEGELTNKLDNSNMCEQNVSLPMPSVCSFASVGMVTDAGADAKIKVLRRPSGNFKKGPLEPTACILETNSDSSSHASDTSIQQETLAGFHEEGSVFSQCSGTEPESLLSLEEAYHPSPVSVLEPAYKEELSSSSECLGSLSTDICDFSETLSEALGMIVSSDEDSVEGSVDDPEENEDLMSLFSVEESRHFSYLCDVLTEAGFRAGLLDMDFGTWHSLECPISLSVFETLEKMFGDQSSWKRSERRLLFDRMNSGLLEILQPCMGVPSWAKPVSKRFNPRMSQGMIEEELWMLLVSQEKEVSKDSAMEMLGEELGSLDLGDDIDLIGREIERLLIDELAAEVF